MNETLWGLWIGCFLVLIILGLFFIKPSLIDYAGMAFLFGTVAIGAFFVVFYPIYYFFHI